MSGRSAYVMGCCSVFLDDSSPVASDLFGFGDFWKALVAASCEDCGPEGAHTEDLWPDFQPG